MSVRVSLTSPGGVSTSLTKRGIFVLTKGVLCDHNQALLCDHNDQKVNIINAINLLMVSAAHVT